MTYFVTGATGFIGRHLLEELLARKGDIHCLVRKSSQGKFNALRASFGKAGERRTAVRPTSEMTSTLPLQATRVLVRRRSSCSR